MDSQTVWPLAEDVMYALGPFYQREMMAAIEASGAPQEWFPLSLAQGADPQPFTLARLCTLSPFTDPRRHAERLGALAGLDLLEQVAPDAYRLTGPGREAVEAIFRAAQGALADVAPLQPDELERLRDLLARVVEAALAAPEPAEKWAMQYSRWTDPGPGHGPMAQIDQYLTDLSRFRDDAHNAAWQVHGLSGAAWEALTFVWRNEADTAAALAERLPFRGYEARVYQDALDTLAARGWLAVEDGAYGLTEAGKTLREQAEAQTDALFYTPWTVLSDPERSELGDLLSRTLETLQAQARQEMWDRIVDTSQAIYAWSRAAVDPVVEGHGLTARGDLYVLLTARMLAPRPLDREGIQRRAPYNHPQAWDENLSRLVESRYLVPAGQEAYRLGGRGDTALDDVLKAFYGHLNQAEPLTAENMARLERLLEGLVEASRAAGEPAEKSRLDLTHRSRSPQAEGSLARIDQFIDELGAFRDDCHLASWRPHGVDGRLWEAFTLVWRGEVRQSAELAERLAHRGFSEADYQAALDSLASRGWLEVRESGYEITPAGQALREAAERATNQVFFAPWEDLSGQDFNSLRYLLDSLQEALKEREPQAA